MCLVSQNLSGFSTPESTDVVSRVDTVVKSIVGEWSTSGIEEGQGGIKK